MRNLSTRLVLSAWMISGFVFGQAHQAGPAGWKGQIVVENGIRTVKNPDQPLSGELAFELEEDLAIGGDPEKEDYYFPKGTSGLAVDEEGKLFISDWTNARVQMYDKNGKFIRTIGRKGQGPGEFRSPGRLQFDRSGRLCVFDYPAIQVFDQAGRFVEKIFSRAVNDPFLLSSGAVYWREFIGGKPGAFMEAVSKKEPDETAALTIARFRGEFKEGQTYFVHHVYTSRASLTPIDDSSFAYGFSADYRFFVADASGQTVLIVEKEEAPVKITAAEKDWIRKQDSFLAYGSGPHTDLRKEMIFPDHRPYFQKLLADDQGRIYALKIKPVLETDSSVRADVFSRAGICSYRLTIPVQAYLIKAGYLYEVREDKEAGEFRIVRHRIRNWDQLK
jgi:hypothetical protein